MCSVDTQQKEPEAPIGGAASLSTDDEAGSSKVIPPAAVDAAAIAADRGPTTDSSGRPEDGADGEYGAGGAGRKAVVRQPRGNRRTLEPCSEPAHRGMLEAHRNLDAQEEEQAADAGECRYSAPPELCGGAWRTATPRACRHQMQRLKERYPVCYN